MKKHYPYNKKEQELNTVLAYQQKTLSEINIPQVDEKAIFESERLLESLSYALPTNNDKKTDFTEKQEITVPSWEQLYEKAAANVGKNSELTDFFSKSELDSNESYIRALSSDFSSIHHLDLLDYSICAIAGILSGALGILSVGIPHNTSDGTKAGPLSNFIRREFDKRFPPEEMAKLSNARVSKVPFDAQDNRHTTIHVEGLSSYYHRLLSLGHDPLLGFVVGIFDIMTGRMTTIDKTGKIVSQVMENYADRKERNIFSAIAKLFIHLKSDFTTSMGLPAPMMALFNLLQFASIGEENQTISEIVQGMYYEGYDFIHFCSASLPVLLTEIIVRISYAIRKLREGYSIKESIPFSLNREKHPKLATMLFIAHSAATAINAGTVLFTKNPMAINYPQWMSFAKYSFKQLKWALVKKPMLRDRYISGYLDDEFEKILESAEVTINRFSDKYIFVLTE